VFGSRARGEARANPDLDVLVLIGAGDWELEQAVARAGYLLAVGSGVVPSLMLYTAAEWAQRRREKAPFWQAVARDGVAVR
jgi:predicted nucleotidyltransferase